MEKKSPQSRIDSLIVLFVVLAGALLVLADLWTNVNREVAASRNQSSIYQAVSTPGSLLSQPEGAGSQVAATPAAGTQTSLPGSFSRPGEYSSQATSAAGATAAPAPTVNPDSLHIITE